MNSRLFKLSNEPKISQFGVCTRESDGIDKFGEEIRKAEARDSKIGTGTTTSSLLSPSVSMVPRSPERKYFDIFDLITLNDA